MIESVLGKSVAANLSTGGTVDGDLTITGNLGVAGDASINLTSVVSNSTIIDATGTEAFLVRKNSDGGDIFLVDTTNSNAELTGDLTITNTAANIGLTVTQTGGATALFIQQDTAAYALSIDHNANQSAIYIDADGATSSSLFYVNAPSQTTGNIIHIDNPAVNTGNVINIASADALTTGSAITVDSGGTALASTATGGLVEILHTGNSTSNVNNLLYIVNDHASATGTTGLKIQQDSTGQALHIISPTDSSMTIEGEGARSDANTPRAHLNFVRDVTSGTVANDDVAAIVQVQATDAGGNDGYITEIQYLTSTATAGSVVSDVVWKTVQGAGIGTRTEAMRIQGGNVGINTATPDGQLDVFRNDTATTGQLVVQQDGAGDAAIRLLLTATQSWMMGIDNSDSDKFKISSDGTGVETATKFTIDTSGNLGVGTAIPTDLLTVAADLSSGTNAGIHIAADVDDDAYLDLTEQSSTLVAFGATNAFGFRMAYDGGTKNLTFKSGYNTTVTDRMVINRDTGAVEIGGLVSVGAGADATGNDPNGWNATSEAKLQVASDSSGYDSAVQIHSSSADRGLDLWVDGNQAISYIDSRRDNDAGNLVFRTKTAGTPIEALTITGAGLCGIGESVPEAPLHVKGSSFPVAMLERTAGSGTTGASAALSIKTTTTGNMADTFGAEMQFRIEDTSATNQPVGAINAVRAGADNTGNLQFMSYSTGSQVKNLVLDANSRISLSNNDSSGAVGTTLLGYNAGLSIVSGAIENTFIGHAVSDATMTNAADYNTGVGAYALSGLTAGHRNTAIGAYSLVANTSGTYNTAVGTDALGTNATTHNNTAVGQQSGYYTTGADNTYLGFKAGFGASGAEANNVAVGSNALLAITTGSGNTSLGMNSNITVTSTSNNTAIGYQAHKGNGSENTVLGAYALDNTSSEADQTVVIGYAAMRGDTTAAADGTVALGASALTALTAGERNLAIGTSALATETVGDYCVAVGYEALTSQIGVDGTVGNTAVGYGAGASITSGINNTILGYLAGDGFDAESGNTFIGAQTGGGSINGADDCVSVGKDALSGAATQDGTVAVGKDCLAALTDGASNTAVGFESLAVCTTGKRNTAVGYQTFKANMNVGDNNTAIGHAAFYTLNPDTDDHGENTAVGSLSGYYATTGTGNTCIGYASAANATSNLTTGDNNTILGASTSSGNAAASNRTVIGANAVGNGDNSVVLGDDNVTAVYAAEDSGATVYCSGVNFPDTQAASGDANTLDDYEEGTWTPVLKSGSTTITRSGGTDTATYTKIGNMVTVQWSFGSVTTAGSFENAASTVTGLPFTSGTARLAHGSVFSIFGSTSFSAIPHFTRVDTGTTVVDIMTQSATAYSSPEIDAVGSGTWGGFTLTYWV